MVALQCGGSDGWSGVTANPGLGAAADLLVRQGGTVVLGETTEVYGGEHLLTRRAQDTRGRAGADRPDPVVGAVHRVLGRLDRQQPDAWKQGGRADDDLREVARRDREGGLDAAQPGRRLRRAGHRARLRPHGHPRLRPGLRHGPGRRRLQRRRLHHRPRLGVRLQAGAVDQDRHRHATSTPTRSRTWTSTPARCSTASSLDELGSEIFEEILAVASGKRTKSELAGIGDEEFNPWILGATL